MPGLLSQLGRPIADLAERSRMARAPREGYFSVLDELAQDLPQNREFSREEILQRLKAGNQFRVDDMSWPLRQEEIDYALLPALKDQDKLTAARLVDRIRANRPDFFSKYDPRASREGTEYSTIDIKGPRHKPETYFESVTRSPNFGTFYDHFGSDTLSWSRGAAHDIGTPEDPELLRLIVELQNDRANAARLDARGQKPKESGMPAVGWRPKEPPAAPAAIHEQLADLRARSHELTDQASRIDPNDDWAVTGIHPRGADLDRIQAESLALWQQADDLMNSYLSSSQAYNSKIPDQPFKDPASYGRLEIKNAILDALTHKQQGIGISPRSPVGLDETGQTYHHVYPGELKKIANQYRGEMQTRDLPTNQREAYRWQALELRDLRDIADLLPYPGRGNFSTLVTPASQMADELIAAAQKNSIERGNQLRLPPGTFDPFIDRVQLARKRYEQAAALADELHNPRKGITATTKVVQSNKAEHAADMANSARNELISSLLALESSMPISLQREILKVPYAKFTPEFNERVTKYGFPLFSIAGAAALTPPDAPASDQDAFNAGDPDAFSTQHY